MGKSKKQKIKEVLRCYEEVIDKKRENNEQVKDTPLYNRYLELFKRKENK